MDQHITIDIALKSLSLSDVGQCSIVYKSFQAHHAREMCNYIKSGVPVEIVAYKFGCSVQEIMDTIKQFDLVYILEKPKRGFSEDEKDLIHRLRKNGVSASTIAERLGCERTKVYNFITKYGGGTN